ncbi:hypothetical protein EDB84DRAFT_1626333 [Lactarius hengduanensis]|nr:hypothetical protein EDB84DRAFT_1626333 [Lactarius hengduanensis]
MANRMVFIRAVIVLLLVVCTLATPLPKTEDEDVKCIGNVTNQQGSRTCLGTGNQDNYSMTFDGMLLAGENNVFAMTKVLPTLPLHTFLCARVPQWAAALTTAALVFYALLRCIYPFKFEVMVQGGERLGGSGVKSSESESVSVAFRNCDWRAEKRLSQKGNVRDERRGVTLRSSADKNADADRLLSLHRVENEAEACAKPSVPVRDRRRRFWRNRGKAQQGCERRRISWRYEGGQIREKSSRELWDRWESSGVSRLADRRVNEVKQGKSIGVTVTTHGDQTVCTEE